MSFDPAEHPHRRRNLLTGEWVLVSPQRSNRPWLGQVDRPEQDDRLGHDPGCYLCPGNTRANGETNPDYSGPYVFANDFAALTPDTSPPDLTDRLFAVSPARGEARVICFSPDHARTLPELTPAEREAVVDCWCAEAADLGARWRWVQLFENKGAMMGCSNPHPHGQIWAHDFLPTIAAAEDRTQREWLAEHGQPLLAELAEREAGGEREVCSNRDWLALVPWWAAWPFETLLVARFDAARLPDLSPGQRRSLAAILGELTARCDNLFACPFPYSMGWHGAPFDAADAAHWRLHAHLYPPLLRSASVRKFMVGYEMLAEAQRDISPEQAAARLRACAPVHYRNRP